MQLLLTTPGVLLAQENKCFLLRKNDQKKLLSPLKVESIVIAHHAQITSQAIVLAMEHRHHATHPHPRLFPPTCSHHTSLPRLLLQKHLHPCLIPRGLLRYPHVA